VIIGRSTQSDTSLSARGFPRQLNVLTASQFGARSAGKPGIKNRIKDAQRIR